MSVCRTCAGYGYARGGQCWNCKGSGSEPEDAGAEAPSVVGAEARDFLEFLACYNDGTTAHARSKKWPKWSRECDLLVRGSIGKSWLADTARNVLAALSPQALGEELGSSPKAGLPTEGQEAAVVDSQTVEISWAYEYRNAYSDGEWKRSAFHKATGGIPTTRAEAAAMVEKNAQNWIGGTELRLVERVTTTSPADVFVSPLPVTERDAWGIYQPAPSPTAGDE